MYISMGHGNTEFLDQLWLLWQHAAMRANNFLSIDQVFVTIYLKVLPDFLGGNEEENFMFQL